MLAMSVLAAARPGTPLACGPAGQLVDVRVGAGLGHPGRQARVHGDEVRSRIGQHVFDFGVVKRVLTSTATAPASWTP